MEKLKGVGIANGIAIGKVLLILDEDTVIVEQAIQASQVPQEIERFRRALDTAKDQIRAIKSQVKDKSKVGENLYNRGVINSVLMAEAIRTAQQITGRKAITGAEMRVGLENLDLTAERLKEIGLEGFTNPIRVTCKDHAGAHPIYIQQKASDWIEPMRDAVRPLLEDAAVKYVADKPGWETQECK